MPAPGVWTPPRTTFVRKMRREIFKHTQFLLPKNHHTGSPIFLPMWWLCSLLNCKSLESYNSSTISFTLIAIFRAFFLHSLTIAIAPQTFFFKSVPVYNKYFWLLSSVLLLFFSQILITH